MSMEWSLGYKTIPPYIQRITLKIFIIRAYLIAVKREIMCQNRWIVFHSPTVAISVTITVTLDTVRAVADSRLQVLIYQADWRNNSAFNFTNMPSRLRLRSYEKQIWWSIRFFSASAQIQRDQSIEANG